MCQFTLQHLKVATLDCGWLIMPRVLEKLSYKNPIMGSGAETCDFFMHINGQTSPMFPYGVLFIMQMQLFGHCN
jgi:hypothetical protein